MPVSNNNMGLGILQQPNTYFKRKYRWSFALETPCGAVPENLVKISSRPQLDIEEQEINYMHGKMWIPGKAAWQTMTVTYYDVVSGGSGQGDISNLYCWLNTVYEFMPEGSRPPLVGQEAKNRQSSIRGSGTSQRGYAATANLYLYDGIGNQIETWTLEHVWPQSINFMDLDYSSSEELTVELTLRYSSATYGAYGCATMPQTGTHVGCVR